MPALALLLLAVAAEVGATATLPRTRGFTEPGWSALVVAGYLAAIWLLGVVVQRMDVSVVYAVWAGLGVAAVAVIGHLFLGEDLGPARLLGLGLVVSGVVVLTLHGGGH